MVVLHLSNCFHNQWKSLSGVYWACAEAVIGDKATVCMQTNPGQTCPSGEQQTINRGEAVRFGDNRFRVIVAEVGEGWCSIFVSETPADLCAGVTCPPKCMGDDLYRQSCVNGVCEPDLMLMKNAPGCVDDKPPVEETLYLISPIGIGTLCEQIIALVHNGKKYWISQPEYLALGSPAWEEVSITKFNSYPDGTTQTIVNGVTIISRSTSVCVPAVEEDKPSGWIGATTQQIHEEIGEDEITFKIPITNKSSKTTYNYIKLYDASGKEIDKEPDWLYESISPGSTKIITMTSKWKGWSIENVQSQTVTFKLFSSFSKLSGFQQTYMRAYVVPSYKEKPPEPEPELKPVENPTGAIWPIKYQIHKEVGKDEITFTIPITNTSSETTHNYIQLYDAAGKKLEREPDTHRTIAPGAASDITLTSRLDPFWSIENVQSQTVIFKLFSSFSKLYGYDLADTRMHQVEAYDEAPLVEPPYEPPVEPPYEPPVEPPYEPPVEPPYEPPVEPPYEPPVEPPVDKEDNVLMYIALFAIAFTIFSSG